MPPESQALHDTLLPVFLSDVTVERAPAASTLAGATARGVLWQAAPGRFLLEVPGVARYFVEAGQRITVEPLSSVGPSTDDGSFPEPVVRFLRMTPLAALRYQRGRLAFHAAAAVPPGRDRGAVLLAGDSGAGKSTLVAALLGRGWRLLADDLAVVDLDASGRPLVYATFPEFILWPDAAEKLGVEGAGTSDASGRHVLTAEAQFATGAHPLQAVYWLTAHHRAETACEAVEGLDTFRVMGLLTYNSHVADALLDRTAHLMQAATVARTAPLFRLRRPRGRWSVEELADHVIRTACPS